jgi:hypothetical protein
VNELAERIREEVAELQRVVARLQAGWQRAQKTADDFYLDGVALNLHGFYSGLERLFELIATQVDDSLPDGAVWHKELLDQMAVEIPSVRPAVISEETRADLDPFRGFRHVVRNVYTHALLPERMAGLVSQSGPLFERLRVELLAFADFLGRPAPLQRES